MDPSSLTRISALILVAAVAPCNAGSTGDHLVPVPEAYGSAAAYQKLWQAKLLVTPGDVARFVGLPGTVGEETAVSVYQKTNKTGAGTDDYWLTVTQASKRIWDAVPAPGVEKATDPQTIAIQRCDTPLPESTAVAIHKVWLRMLSRTKPERDLENTLVEGSREIFSATDSNGVIMRGQRSSDPKKDTLALVALATSLMEYCSAPVSERPEQARKIEKDASALLKRLQPLKAQHAASSPKAAIKPER